MSQHRMSDVIGILRGAKVVAEAVIKHQEETVKHIVKTSSLKTTAEKCLTDNLKTLNNIKLSKVRVSFENKYRLLIPFSNMANVLVI